MSKYLEYFKGAFDASVIEKIKPENKPYVAYSKEENRVIYTTISEPEIDLTIPYVTFIAEEDGSSIGLAQLSPNQTLDYSTDTTTWDTFDTTTNIPLNNGDKVYVRGVLSADNTSSKYTQFDMSGKIAASGNCNAIWNYEDLNAPLKAYCGYELFSGCSSLTAAPELPATELAKYCYQSMFRECASLTTAPELPATTLTANCYKNMFMNCRDLTTAPELPATELAEYCYNSMFNGCTALTTVPTVLPAATLVKDCYCAMFSGCSSLTTAPELPATELAEWCYQYMFQSCTSLTTAPELPATVLAPYCYEFMFAWCANLNYITCLATDKSALGCTSNWISGVSSTGTFIKHVNEHSWTTGIHGIPSGWTVKDSYTPQECVKLEITADDVSARKTSTTIYYTATTNGIDYNGDRVEGIIISKTAISSEFEQNKSYTDTVERTITFEFMGVTATTTITQDAWVDKSCKVILNNQWRLSETQSNPDSTLYDGVYESFSNIGVNNSTATMYIDLVGYSEFDIYIRSNAESKYDYVTISEPNSNVEKANTKGNQNSSQDINSYTKVHYDNLTDEENRITITYRKDVIEASGNDQGYVLIPKQ